MSKIILANGEELECEGVHSRKISYQNTTREALTFLFSPDKYTLEEISSKFTASNCVSIYIVDANENRYLHEDYSIRVYVSEGYQEDLGIGTNDEVLPKFVSVKMAQLTYAEKQIQQQQNVLDTMVISMLEG